MKTTLRLDGGYWRTPGSDKILLCLMGEEACPSDDATCADAEGLIAKAAEAGAAGLVVPVVMEGEGGVQDLATLTKLADVAGAKGIAVVPELRCLEHAPGSDCGSLAEALRGVSAAASSGARAPV